MKIINLEISHLKEFVPVLSSFDISSTHLKGYTYEIENLNKDKITLKEQINDLNKELVVARNRGKVLFLSGLRDHRLKEKNVLVLKTTRRVTRLRNMLTYLVVKFSCIVERKVIT